MPSSSRASFQLRQGELSPAAAGAASGPSSRLRGASVSQTLPISDPSCGRENPEGGGKLNCTPRFLRCVPDERASAREDPGPRGGRLGRLPSPLWGGVGGGGRCCGASGVPHNDPHPARLRYASAGGPPPQGGGQMEVVPPAEVPKGEPWFFSLRRSRHGLEQHGAALAAADAFGGDALAHAEAFHRVDEV